ncbi:hypothetical protein LguiA_036425 [Lonicera macranthoides]
MSWSKWKGLESLKQDVLGSILDACECSRHYWERHSQKRMTKNSSDWTDNESFVLLEIWGDRFLQFGRKSLRNEDCGVDSEEYVFMNPRVYLNQSNALDEMRDNLGESSEEDDDDDSDGLPPKRKEGDNGLSFRLVADSGYPFKAVQIHQTSQPLQEAIVTGGVPPKAEAEQHGGGH